MTNRPHDALGSRLSLIRNSRGVTLTELMVAVAIVSIGILGMFNAFRYIMASMVVSQKNTLATNLAQQQIEILKDLGYYSLLLTTATATIPGTSQLYDTSNYPPQVVNVNGQVLTIYTNVTMAQMNNNVIGPAGSNYPDTGLKQITSTVVWMDRGVQRSLALNNLLENPNVATLDSGVSGTITSQGGAALSGALVKIQENPSWFGYANASGQYSFAVVHGSWTVDASSSGYYDAITPVACAASAYTNNVNLSLLAVASGTITTGSVWYNPGLVISQIVGTTTTATSQGAQDVEYVELFNPTTFQINLANAPGSGNHAGEYFYLNTQHGITNYSDILSCGGTKCVYISSYVPAGGYFLIASVPQFMANGQWVTADAYYNNSASPPNYIPNYVCGSVQLTDVNNKIVDQVCWNGPACGGVTLNCNGTMIPTDPNCGLNTGGSPCTSSWLGNQLVRYSSPTVLGRGTFGSAYDSQQNNLDFIYPSSPTLSTYGLQYNPFTKASPALPVISGIPATNAQVAATDLFSASTLTVTSYATSPAPWSQQQPYASFTLGGVATGTWSVAVASASGNNVQSFGQVGNITVNQGAATAVPNASTTAPWPAANIYSVKLTSTAAVGFVKGQVVDANLNPLSGIQVQAGGAIKATGSNGLYFMEVSTGAVAVIANPGNQNATYVQQIVQTTVNSSQVVVKNFTLSQGGIIQGYVASGTTPVPQIVAVALNAAGSQAGQATTDSTGHFSMSNVSTGTFTVQLALAPGQTSSPASTSVTITANAPNVFSSSFSLVGALATFSGTVSYNNAAVVSGALIIVSTGAIPSPPNSIQGANANTQTPVYAISSLADGSFSVPVQANNNPYNILVSMPVVAPNGAVTMHTNTYSVSIATPSTTVTKALTVP